MAIERNFQFYIRHGRNIQLTELIERNTSTKQE